MVENKPVKVQLVLFDNKELHTPLFQLCNQGVDSQAEGSPCFRRAILFCSVLFVKDASAFCFSAVRKSYFSTCGHDSLGC